MIKLILSLLIMDFKLLFLYSDACIKCNDFDG